MNSSPVQILARAFLPNLIQNLGSNYFELVDSIDNIEILHPNDVPTEYRRLSNLLQKAAELTDCEHIGILLGQAGDTDSFGPLYLEALKAPTIGAAINGIAAEFRAQDRGAIIELTAGDVACLRYIIVDPAIDTGATISDAAMAIARRILAELCGPGWAPELVELSRREPRDCRPYRHHFRCPIAFNSTVAAIHFDGAWLDRPLAIRRAAPYAAIGLIPRASGSPEITERVILQLTRSISTGVAISASKVARQFGICDRTLQRELTKAQTSYRSLSEDVHYGVAKRLLQDTDMSVTEIALALGYADASVLTRAFTRWAGACPSEWRSRKQPHSSIPTAAEEVVPGFISGRSVQLQPLTA
jgi:AraC-like DNA-binding protein